MASLTDLIESGDIKALPKKKYSIIYADPPWDYKGQLQHAGPNSGDTGGATKHYPTVTLSELKTWPMIWCPKQTPRIGIRGAKYLTI